MSSNHEWLALEFRGGGQLRGAVWAHDGELRAAHSIVVRDHAYSYSNDNDKYCSNALSTGMSAFRVDGGASHYE